MSTLATVSNEPFSFPWQDRGNASSTSNAPSASSIAADPRRPAKQEQLFGTRGVLKPRTTAIRPVGNNVGAEQRLFDALVAMKVKTAEVAMHFSVERRNSLFRYLDFLHDFEDWHSDDEPGKLSSFTTFLRMILFVGPATNPGMGLTSTGNLVATWSGGGRHLTIECLPKDEVVWSVVVHSENDPESAAGRCGIQRIKAVLAPYELHAWISNVG